MFVVHIIKIDPTVPHLNGKCGKLKLTDILSKWYRRFRDVKIKYEKIKF